LPKRNESLGHIPEKDIDRPVTFACPMCGKLMSEPRLLDVQSVITKGWYFVQKIRIFDSKVVFEYEFDHYRDEEEDIGMEESNTAVAVISTEFDGTGECTVFDILEERPCDTEGFMKEKSMEVEEG